MNYIGNYIISTQIELAGLLNDPPEPVYLESGFSSDQVTIVKKNSDFEFTTTLSEPSLKEIYLHDQRYIFNRPLIYEIEQENDYFVMQSKELV